MGDDKHKPLWMNYHTSSDSMTRLYEKQRFDKLDEYLWDKRIHHAREKDKHPQYSQEYLMHVTLESEYSKEHEVLRAIIEQIDEVE